MPVKPNANHIRALRAHGLKNTPARLAALGLLHAEQYPIGVQDIRKKSKRNMDKVTLYRSLETLAETPLVRRIDLRHGHADYELALDREHHHHLVCTVCGKIEDFVWCPEQYLRKEILKSAKHFARLTDHSLEFFGVCKKCSIIT